MVPQVKSGGHLRLRILGRHHLCHESPPLWLPLDCSDSLNHLFSGLRPIIAPDFNSQDAPSTSLPLVTTALSGHPGPRLTSRADPPPSGALDPETPPNSHRSIPGPLLCPVDRETHRRSVQPSNHRTALPKRSKRRSMNSTHSSSVAGASSSDSPLFSRTDSFRTHDTGVTVPDSGDDVNKNPPAAGPGAASPVNASSNSKTNGRHHHHHHHHRHSTGSSPKVVYGAGAVARLPTELGKLSLSAPLIVSSPSRLSLARRVQALIPNLDTRILDSALVNVPQRVVDDAVARVTGRDSVISVGGASAMRLAKAIASKKSIPHICIPTTYSGSESPLLGDVRRRKSRSQRQSDTGESTASKRSNEDDTQTMPEMIIYDEDLTSTSTNMVISAPNDTRPPAGGCSTSMDDDAQWSYISLPGV